MNAADGGAVELALDGFAHGGAAVGRLPDGRACFVDHGIPGERVRVRIDQQRRRWARGTVVEVLEPSPDRVTPPCPFYGPDRCGGCAMQHIAPARQATLLGDAIAQQIRRIGHLDVPDDTVEVIRPHRPDGLGYRNRARFAITADGRLAFRRARSHDLIAVDDCPLLTAPARTRTAAMAGGWQGASEVQLQVGTDGGATLAVTAGGGEVVVPTDLPAVVRHPGRRDHRRVAPQVRHEVAGRTFMTSATSFFQASVAAAEVLVDLVRSQTPVDDGAHVVDCYAGVGLFSAVLAGDGAHVTAIEADRRACADARHNTRDLPVDVLPRDLTHPPAVTRPVDAVVLDPPRAGAGPEVIAWIAALEPPRVTYVSCDPATFARDARALVDRGFAFVALTGVDQFTHTGHVELVAAFERRP